MTIDNNTEPTILDTPAPDSAPVESATDDSQDGAGREEAKPIPAHIFIGIDGAARAAGVGVIILTEGGAQILTFPVDTQGKLFYSELYALVQEILTLNLNVLAVTIAVEAPPPGRFAHVIGRSVNFASGKIVGTLGVLLSSIGVPVPREVVFASPTQWRAAVLRHKTRTYTKDIAREYVRKNIHLRGLDQKTDDEVEALCIAMYGMQGVFKELELVDTKKTRH